MNKIKYLILFLGILFTSCTSDMSKFDAIVNQLEQEDIPLDSTIVFKVNNLDDSSSIERFQGNIFIRTEMVGITWAHKTEDDFCVFIQTNIPKHGGSSEGYAYSRKGKESDWAIYGEREGWWTLGKQVNENWWKIYSED